METAQKQYCEIGQIVVLTADKFFYAGICTVIDLITPELVQKQSIVFDVKYIDSLNSINPISQDDNVFLIIDQNILNSYWLIYRTVLNEAMSGFSVMTITDRPVDECERHVLSKKITLEEAKSKLFDFLSSSDKDQNYFLNDKFPSLTTREILIVQRVFKGYRPARIAKELGLDTKQFSYQKRKIYKKFGINTLKELIDMKTNHFNK